MKIQYLLLLFISVLPISMAHAEDGETLLRMNGCTNCHQSVNKAIGPSLAAIKEKFGKDCSVDSNAAWKLHQKVRSGGSGTWGKVPMPATPYTVSDVDIMKMIAAIVSPVSCLIK